MAISDKLNYLIETKSKFKDRLNSLGAEIINSTTFRNYMVWVNDFYNKASDKTYLAETGIVGRTSQSETPTADSPQPINNLTGNVRFTIGKEEESENLFDDSTKNNTWVAQYRTSIYIEEKSFGSNCIEVGCASGDTYTLSATFSGTNGAIAIGFFDANFNGLDYHIRSGSQNMTITATAPENTAFMYAGHASEEPASITLVKGSGSSGSSKTFTIPLGDIELCEIDTYEDKIYSNNGRFYLEKNTDKTVLDGSEIIQLFSVTGGNLFRFQDMAISVSNISPKSNYFIGVSNSSSRYDGTVYYNYNAAPNRMVFDILTTKFTTVSEFKSWLLTHNTELQFAIPASSTTEITSSNYPELYSVLKEIQDYLTQYKINKEFLLDYSSPEITY